MRLPVWLRQEIISDEVIRQKELFKKLQINTVCQSAHCPNINSCFSQKIATFMILGDKCTRSCKFCAINKPPHQKFWCGGKIDQEETKRIVEAIRILNLDYVVITSVTRDDLIDGGASQFKKIIKEIHLNLTKVKIEILIPDFNGNDATLKMVVEENLDVIGHNLETVPRLYPQVRFGADYNRSLKILRNIKALEPRIVTKSGLMLGLGETEKEIIETLKDLRSIDCDIITLGQYLAPSREHLEVKRFVCSEEFEFYKNKALGLGFKAVSSGPLVRSSYQAKNIFEDINKSLPAGNLPDGSQGQGEKLCTI